MPIPKPRRGDPILAKWGGEVVDMLTKVLSGDPQPPAKPRKGDIIQPEWGEAVVDCLTVLEPWINHGWRHYRTSVLSEDTQEWIIETGDIPPALFYLVLFRGRNVHSSNSCDIYGYDSSTPPQGFLYGGYLSPGEEGVGISIILTPEGGQGFDVGYGLTNRRGGYEIFPSSDISNQIRIVAETEGLIGRGAKLIILYL